MNDLRESLQSIEYTHKATKEEAKRAIRNFIYIVIIWVLVSLITHF